ncbi:MAG: cytochrome c3 family protein [Desulfobacterales bacterium]|nr:cytochrome c3 family protein [Desulfobacterales bacterium]
MFDKKLTLNERTYDDQIIFMPECRQVENYTLLENPKKYCGQMIASSVILSLIFFFVLFFVFFPSQNSYARVTGTCSNCHTMHNSQGGDSMALVGGSLTEDAVPAMLVSDCVGCHTGENTADSTTPYVMGMSEPVFGKNGNTLAGGNFWWVAQGDDNKGHNVAGITSKKDSLDEAPGSNSGCGGCHSSLVIELSDFLQGHGLREGCCGCHLTPKHHANDGTGTKLVNSAEQGWYRFLSGHETGAGMGVVGIEDKKWNYDAINRSSHNEYLGNVKSGGSGFGNGLGYTTTAFCTGCHGEFHTDQNNENGQWIRHPSDFKIPDSGEYTDAFGGEYDPYVPVARTSLAGGVSSEVTPGSDMVMCLSCHVAHGSPYPDMLRWDYDDMIAGTTNPAVQGTGCFKCHTEKDGGD